MEVFQGNDLAITRESLYGTQSEPTYGGITSFMRRRYTRDLNGVDLVVSGIPFDTATSNRPGTRFGPRAIRAASIQSAWERPFPWEFDPFDHLAVIDYGDCNFDYGQPQKTPAAIEAHADYILGAGCGMLTLGGITSLAIHCSRPMRRGTALCRSCTLTLTVIPGRMPTTASREFITALCSITPPARA
jgi:agmatinase